MQTDQSLVERLQSRCQDFANGTPVNGGDIEMIEDLCEAFSALEGEVEGLKASISQSGGAEVEPQLQASEPSAAWSLEHIEHWLRQALIKAQKEANHRFPECEAKYAFVAGAQIAVREVAGRLLPTPIIAPPPRLPDSQTEGWRPDREELIERTKRYLSGFIKPASDEWRMAKVKVEYLAKVLAALEPPTPPSGEGGS